MSIRSFADYGENARFGDTVFLYLNLKCIYVQTMTPGSVFQTKFGAFKHDDVVGSCYGQKVFCSRGWLYLLKPTPELWTLTLPHRTQILYFHDISLISALLDLKPGTIVVEAGTGSGSLSHSMARTIAPNGHLYTFDFHEDRVVKAREEFAEHGLTDLVTIEHRDVCKIGFGECLEGRVDALFLDLPHPWEAVPFAKKALKPKGSRICCFSPCIQQVEKTCSALRENRFVEVTTSECVLRPYEVKQTSLSVLDFDKSFSTRTGSPPALEPEEAVPVKMDQEPKDAGGKGEKQSDQPSRESGPPAGDKAKPQVKEYPTPVPIINVVGHTGFLTFATTYQ